MTKKIEIQYDLKHVPYKIEKHFALEEYLYEVASDSEENLISTSFEESLEEGVSGSGLELNQDPKDAQKTYRVVMNIWQPGHNQPDDGRYLNRTDDPDATLMVKADHYFTVDLQNSDTHREVVFPVAFFIV